MTRQTFLRSVAFAAAAGGAIGLVACATPLDRAWTLSQRAHVAQMIENPKAGLDDHDRAAPLDGMSTDAALVKHRSQEAEIEKGPSPPVINVGIGSRG